MHNWLLIGHTTRMALIQVNRKKKKKTARSNFLLKIPYYCFICFLLFSFIDLNCFEWECFFPSLFSLFSFNEVFFFFCFDFHSTGTYAPAIDILGIANSFYPVVNTPLHVFLTVIDTAQKRVPLDLMGMDWSSSTLLTRFNNFQSYVFSKLANSTIASYSIG